MPNDVAIYDTTLRDGSQGEGISFSLDDKVRIARRLDEFGMDFIEGGWPGSNPKDIDFFARVRQSDLSHAKLAAFGSTRRPGVTAETDDLMQRLVAAETPVITIFGKSWDFHVTHALKVSLAENLAMIHDSVAYLVRHTGEVVYDAEHFFDGYKHNPAYALKCLAAARDAGASVLVLCDTNGGSLPHEIQAAVEHVRRELDAPIGIHAHDDGACGVANSLSAVLAGAVHVQGTVNGYGERCGNADLCGIVANLLLKLGKSCLKPASLSHLTAISQYVDERANLAPRSRQPFVGRSAFAHKAGVHVDAVLKHRATYEHIDPEAVGNSRRMLVSELSGGGTIVSKAAKHELDLTKKSPETRQLLKTVAAMERDGYSFEGAEASFELLMIRAAGVEQRLFDLRGFRIIVEKRGDTDPITEATVKLAVGESEELVVAEGDGPVHALDSALRKALRTYYPELGEIHLHDFKVRVVSVEAGTAAKVRTIIDSSDGETTWSTVGVSTNMIEASWNALVDGVVYGLHKKRAISSSTTDGGA